MNSPLDITEKLGKVRIGIRKDVVITRQREGGGARYVAHDPVTFKNHVFSPLEYRVMTALVPERSLQEAFTSLVAARVLSKGNEETFYDFVLQLHSMGVLQLPIVQADKLFERYVGKRAEQRRRWYKAFVYHKVPLLNPDRFIERTLPMVGWLFSKVGVILWALLMSVVLWKCWGRLPQLFEQTGTVLMSGNLPFLLVTLVALKVIHEFGHAYVCRRLGGDVPEMGVVFIFLTPCAYMDASSSWKLDNRWQRIAVAMGGMYIESIVAGIFALIWAGTSPGFAHDLALNVVVMASIVTVFFNINPLVKFDGYFVLSDLMGIVNLQEQASLHLKGFAQRTVLGLSAPAVAASARERWILTLYGPCAFLYKVFLAVTITSLVVLKWPDAGIFVGAIFAWSLIVEPVRRIFSYLWSSEDTEPKRMRSRMVAMGLVGVLPFLLAFLPMSSSLSVPGVLDPRERVSVRAPDSGFVMRQPVQHGVLVSDGELLFVLENPDLQMDRVRLLGEVEAERIRLDSTEVEDPARAATHRARLEFLEATLAQQDNRLAALSVSAPLTGTVVAPEGETWLGRWVERGDELFQVHGDNHYVRIVLTDHEVMRARLEVGSEAEVRWVVAPGKTAKAVVREIRRSASRTNVPIEVTMIAGGDVYAEPIMGDETKADRPYLHVFLEVESVPVSSGGRGLTARVRLHARVESLASWLRRRILNFINAWKMS